MYNLKSLVIDIPEDIKRLITYGNFTEADRLIDIYLKRNIPSILKDRLNFEKHRIKRLKEDYIYSYDQAFNLAQEKIKNFTKKELDKLKDERYTDWIYFDGEIMFHKMFLENIIKIHPDIKGRLSKDNDEGKDAKKDKLLNKTINDIKKYGQKSYFIHIKTGIKLKKEDTNIGETIRVHLPIPKKARQINNIKILSTSHEPVFISSENYPQRTIYFEEKVKGEDIFTVEYSYENRVSFNNLDYNAVSNVQANFYTEEWLPHITFTPFLISLTEEIVGNEKNPLRKARKIYDYITTNVQYTFVRQYAGIINIPEYAAYNLKGDCGVQALLFITLCRIAGIPARWQSGLYVNPLTIGCHDWAEFYVEPYGWLFADLSFGGSGYRAGNKEKWNFYFGNLDPFRMVANSAFQYNLLPKKKFFRIDPYDNQIGEAEYLNKGIYSNAFESIMEIKEVSELSPL